MRRTEQAAITAFWCAWAGCLVGGVLHLSLNWLFFVVGPCATTMVVAIILDVTRDRKADR